LIRHQPEILTGNKFINYTNHKLGEGRLLG